MGLQGSFAMRGFRFDWVVQPDTGALGGWTLVIVAGDFSVARRYPDELTMNEARNEALKAAPAMVRLIEVWTS
jgi:hypothetical protein